MTALIICGLIAAAALAGLLLIRAPASVDVAALTFDQPVALRVGARVCYSEADLLSRGPPTVRHCTTLTNRTRARFVGAGEHDSVAMVSIEGEIGVGWVLRSALVPAEQD